MTVVPARALLSIFVQGLLKIYCKLYHLKISFQTDIALSTSCTNHFDLFHPEESSERRSETSWRREQIAVAYGNCWRGCWQRQRERG